jgi:hypothetical protein
MFLVKLYEHCKVPSADYLYRQAWIKHHFDDYIDRASPLSRRSIKSSSGQARCSF